MPRLHGAGNALDGRILNHFHQLLLERNDIAALRRRRQSITDETRLRLRQVILRAQDRLAGCPNCRQLDGSITERCVVVRFYPIQYSIFLNTLCQSFHTLRKHRPQLFSRSECALEHRGNVRCCIFILSSQQVLLAYHIWGGVNTPPPCITVADGCVASFKALHRLAAYCVPVFALIRRFTGTTGTQIEAVVVDAVITAEHILELRQVCRVFPGTILRQLVFRKEMLQVRFQT